MTRKCVSLWGIGIKPTFPHNTTMEEIFQGWRNNRVMHEMIALRCPRCHKVFFVMRAELRKELLCPRGCGPARFIQDKERLLERCLKDITAYDSDAKAASGGG